MPRVLAIENIHELNLWYRERSFRRRFAEDLWVFSLLSPAAPSAMSHASGAAPNLLPLPTIPPMNVSGSTISSASMVYHGVPPSQKFRIRAGPKNSWTVAYPTMVWSPGQILAARHAPASIATAETTSGKSGPPSRTALGVGIPTDAESIHVATNADAAASMDPVKTPSIIFKVGSMSVRDATGGEVLALRTCLDSLQHFPLHGLARGLERKQSYRHKPSIARDDRNVAPSPCMVCQAKCAMSVGSVPTSFQALL